MKLEVVKRGAMFAVIPALLALILVTPGLIGRPAVLSAIPALIIGLTDSEVVIDIHGAVDHYRYRSLALELQAEDKLSFRRTWGATEAYDLSVRFPRNATRVFDVHVLISDRQGNSYALNGTVFTGTDEAGDYVSMTDRATFRTVIARAPADFRALIPRGEGG